jgi:phosphate transport system substrate-binding protein
MNQTLWNNTLIGMLAMKIIYQNGLKCILLLVFLIIIPDKAISLDDSIPDFQCPETCPPLIIQEDSSLKVVGSTTIQTIVEKAARDFPGFPVGVSSITIEGGGSGYGFSAVAGGLADLGMVSRRLTDHEKTHVDFSIIGYDALAIIVNSANPIEQITRDQIQDLYTGAITLWPDSPQETEVLLISKMIDRGTLSIFEEYSGLKSPFGSHADNDDYPKISIKAWEAGANLDSILWVGGLKGAIGFVSALEAYQYIAQGMPIKILQVDGFYPDMDNITSGLYPMRRCLKLVYLPENQPAREFADFMLSGTGQDIVLQQGFIPLDFIDDLPEDE